MRNESDYDVNAITGYLPFGTWCPICGPDVNVDEDGCCLTCGATAMGKGADLAQEIRNLLVPLLYTIEDWGNEEDGIYESTFILYEQLATLVRLRPRKCHVGFQECFDCHDLKCCDNQHPDLLGEKNEQEKY